jgi:hypothetical protein
MSDFIKAITEIVKLLLIHEELLWEENFLFGLVTSRQCFIDKKILGDDKIRKKLQRG